MKGLFGLCLIIDPRSAATLLADIRHSLQKKSNTEALPVSQNGSGR
jgi:hypothetical protein